MAEPTEGAPAPEAESNPAAAGGCAARKDKRKAVKKLKRKQLRKEAAIRERDEEAARLDDPEEQLRAREREQEEAEIAERERHLFEERERLWLQAAAARKVAEEEEEEEEEERRRKFRETAQDEKIQHDAQANEFDEDDEWDYIEEGPAEIIWKGNEIIVKKKKIRVAKGSLNKKQSEEDDNRPTSNPFPPQSVAFASYMDGSSVSAQEALDRVAQEVPNFGTEQDKAHCPFHLKTGACRFGSRCSRVHFHPDKSCTLLIKNMYNGPGLAWEQDEGLEIRNSSQGMLEWRLKVTPLFEDGKFDGSSYTDEEVEWCYEEFYEDVHTEFLKCGELVNFKVCNNGSYHLRGNVYVHYKSLDSAILAYNSMNGRYFAGKQITCEFVSVTRWKVAICGEYMKSRLKTCSHGSACNFIHCFRNPGGDYEWADWDNSPPKYWIRKMVALFGPSNEYENDKQVDSKESERQRSSSIMRTPTNKGYHSHRSDSSGSPATGSEKIRDQKRCCSNRNRGEHSTRSKEDLSFVEKHERFKGYDKSVKRHRMHSNDYNEDIYNENDRVEQQKHEVGHYDGQEKYKLKDKADFLRQKRGRSYSIEHMKSKRYKSRVHEKQEYERSLDGAYDDRKLSDGHSDSLANDKSSHSLNIDEERYDGRSHDQSSHRLITIDEERYTGRSSEDFGYSADSSCAQPDAGLPCQSINVSHDFKGNGRHSQFRKEKDDNFRSEGSDPANVHDHLRHSRRRQKGKHDGSIKRKHHYEKGENEDRHYEFSNRREDERILFK